MAKWVAGLAQALGSARFDVDFDRDKVVPGEGTLAGYMGGISTADWVLLVCEPSYRAACTDGNDDAVRLVRAEMEAALGRIQREKRHGVILLLRQGMSHESIPKELEHLQYEDFRDDRNYADTLSRLVSILREPRSREIPHASAPPATASQPRNGMTTPSRSKPLSINNERDRIQEHVDRLRERDRPRVDPELLAVTLDWLRADDPRKLGWFSEKATALKRDERQVAGDVHALCKELGIEDETLHDWCNHRAALLEYLTTDRRRSRDFTQNQNEVVGELGIACHKRTVCHQRKERHGRSTVGDVLAESAPPSVGNPRLNACNAGSETLVTSGYTKADTLTPDRRKRAASSDHNRRTKDDDGTREITEGARRRPAEQDDGCCRGQTQRCSPAAARCPQGFGKKAVRPE